MNYTIDSLSVKLMKYSGGPNRDSTIVPFGDGFLLVAGRQDGPDYIRDTVWQYDPVGNWTLLPGRLQLPRYSPGAMLVEKSSIPPC